jgi:hypothetical protein
MTFDSLTPPDNPSCTTVCNFSGPLTSVTFDSPGYHAVMPLGIVNYVYQGGIFLMEAGPGLGGPVTPTQPDLYLEIDDTSFPTAYALTIAPPASGFGEGYFILSAGTGILRANVPISSISYTVPEADSRAFAALVACGLACAPLASRLRASTARSSAARRSS